jgi:subtilisin family serine protease
VRLFPTAWAFALVALLCACGGGGGGGSAPSVTTPTPTPAVTPTLPATSSAVVSAGASVQTASLSTIAGGYSGTVTLPVATSGSGSASLTLATTNAVAVSSTARALPKAIGGSLDPLVFVTLTPSVNLTFATFPTFAFTLPASVSLPAGASLYLADDPGDVAGGWSTLAGPAKLAGNVVTFPGAAGPVTFTSGVPYAFTLLATAQVLVIATPSPSPSPSPSSSSSASPSPSPTATSSANVAFTCPATGTASFARSSGSSEATVRRLRIASAVAARGTTLLAVTYARATAAGAATHIAERERALQANFVQSLDFAAKDITIRVVAVPSASVAQVESALRSESGVQSVAVTGAQRFASRVTTPYYTNDPYFDGFAPNFEVLPYAEGAAVPGQWDMHAIGLEHAFGYSQPGNGSGIVNVNALGWTGIKIAIIDTGEDASHPELTRQIAYQHCFISNPSGVQSAGSFSTDEDGHGTNVSGIAAAAPNNGLGFTGAAGKAKIYAYRVFPTPDDNCTNETINDDQCSASTVDIAAAINDAVAQHVNVISMSLGGGGCSGGGVDTDAVEGAAVANAIAANIIVVAASGNGGTSSVTAPACDSGVIAAGATSLDDGIATGTTHYTSSAVSAASSSNPVEYVAGYSQYGSPAAAIHRSSAWGIVAPGGDPSSADVSGANPDDLHWIENIWTTTPFGGQNDANFAGTCTVDFNSTNGIIDCRTLIAGTSMATPHVAGAVALILAVAPSYQSPSAMKALLCQTADELNDTHEGCGRLNVYHAMATALGDTVYP